MDTQMPLLKHFDPRLNVLIATVSAALPLLVFSAGAGGWDLTKPLSHYFPPPLAVNPDSTRVGSPALKSGGPTLEDQILELTNQERWNNGELPPLKGNTLLESSSETHSTNMGNRNFFAHCDLDTGDSPWNRIIDAGYFYVYAGENLHAGSSTAAGAMNGWMNSPGHRANILSMDFRELGVGYNYDSSDIHNVRFDEDGNCVSEQTIGPLYHYWTQNFGTRSSVYPVVIAREAYSTATRNVDLYLYGSGWAQEMRIRNENGSWTAWQTFSTDVAWLLSTGAGTKEVFVEIRSGATVRSASDTIVSTDDSVSNTIFEDDFESINTNAWSDTVP